MTAKQGRVRRPIVAGCLLSLTLAAGAVLVIPDVILLIAIVWTGLSVPVGIAVGHCALSEA